jgi:excisionase family DNA binding protein
MKELTVKEATEVLNVSERTVRRMIKRGDLPNAHKKDRKILIPQSDIDAYLSKQQQQAAEAKQKSAPKTKAPSKPKPSSKAKVKKEVKPAAPKAAPRPAEVSKPKPKPQEPEAPAPGPKVKPEPVKTPPVEEPSPTPPPSAEAPPRAEAESPEGEPEWVETLQQQKEIIKEQLISAGVKTLGWLEQSFKTIRAKVEQYKDELLERDDSDKKDK